MRRVPVVFRIIVVVALFLSPGVAAPAAQAGEAGDPCAAPRVQERPLPRSVPDGADLSDQANGSFRLCLDGREPVKGHASCQWTEDRSAVLDVSTEETRLQRRPLRLFLQAATALGRDDPGDQRLRFSIGKVAYETAPDDLIVAGSLEDGFQLRFEAARTGRPAVPSLAGTLGVRCGKAPPLEPDRSLGTLRFRLSGDPHRVFQTPAVCEWAIWEGQTTMVRVDGTTTRAKVADGRFLSLSLDLANGFGRSVEARLAWSSPFDFNGESWRDPRYAFPLWTPQERRAGTVRAHRLLPEAVFEFDPYVDEGPPPDATPMEMVATWECADPPDDISRRIRWPDWRGRPGLVTMDTPVLAAGTLLAASCAASEDEDAGRTDISSVAASFELDGRPALLVGDSTGFVAIYLQAPDGSLGGDLVVGPTGDFGAIWESDDDGHLDVPRVTLERTALTLDPSVPASLPVTMTWDCPPGLGTLA